MRCPAGTLRVVLCLAALGTFGTVVFPGSDDFDTEYARYKNEIRRPSLIKRTLARVRLAETYDPRALDVLIGEYRKPEQPTEQVRYLIAQIATEAFAEAEYLDKLRAWRAGYDAPRDAWLWYQTLTIPIDELPASEPLGVARDKSLDAFLRAAALEAVRWRRSPELLEAIPELLGALPGKPLDRALMVESLASVLSAFGEQRAKPEIAESFKGLCAAMEDPATLPRTQIVLARQFSELLDVPFHWREPGKWLQELQVVQGGGKTSHDERYAGGPTFAGLEATGDHIVYLIDWSDSMLEPLTPEEKAKLPKGPISGTDARRRAKESENKRWKKAFEAVQWSKVTNRFEAARELLKASLLQLDEKQSFAIIGFGDQANSLRCTSGLTHATLGNVQRAFKELDGIRPGPVKDDRPHGTLGGKTNMHGGFLLAYRMTGGRPVGPGEYVDPQTFVDGCDTIFLLSDGDPTWDDFSAHDSRDPGDYAGDPETGTRHADSDDLEFSGPYQRGFYLVSDVRRLNMFRKCEIHCVGMGEANMSLLESLAHIGKGEAISLRDGG